ncbi:MAG: putative tail tape measure protein [Prokaryotic dsDNA virus sp.]|nr:MAG: putative tail tape measure protein [Prokaryotic dsDNA virus sp.]|tara:strand:- start:6061 stop:9966 length:3906 start_codon:yes stop_codon:yes gene_type:complete
MTEMRSSLVVEADGSSIVGESQRITGGLDSVSAAADKTAASFQKITTQSAAAERMQQRLNSTFNSFGANARSAQESAQALDQALRARDAYRALEESIDPLIRAERELAAAQQIVNNAVSSGAATQEDAAQRLQVLNDRYEAIVTSQQRAAASLSAMPSSAGSARASAAVFEEAFRTRDAYRSLEESIDPLIRAERELAAAQQLVNNAMASGAATPEQAARSLQLLQGRYDATVAAQGRVGASSRAMSGSIQNASFQIADAAVQFQAGTAASIIFAQQMPQLLGGMGVLGAVMGAVVAVGAPLVTMLLDTGEAAGSLDERLDKLDTSLQSVNERLEILRDQDLSLTFGTMANDIRGLTEDLLALDRVAELRNLRSVLEEVLQESIQPRWWDRAGQTILSGLTAAAGGMASGAAIGGQDLTAQRFAELTGGRGPDLAGFQTRSQSIIDSAQAGNVERVVSEFRSLVQDFKGDQPLSEMNDELLLMLDTLGKTAQQLAAAEAQLNGSALAARLDKETSALVTNYRQQAELAAAVLQFGENSAEVEAVRNQHARDALTLKLRELGVEQGSVREQEALAALAEAQAAQDATRAEERAKSIRETLTGLSDELAVTQAIIISGEHSAEVERLRTEQARETLRLRLEELGATEEQIAKAEELLEQSRAAARQAQQDRAAREASQSLDGLQRQAEINRAILQYGRDSLEVKRLQIEAARTEYAQSLLTKQISEERRRELLAQWDITNGLQGVDPFGSLATARSILETQTRSIARLELEQSLIGQSEQTRRRVLALYEAELQIRQAGIDAESELADRIREGARAESERAAELERQQDAWETIQKSAEDSIDRIVDAAMDADLPGVFEGIATEIEGILTDLAIKNPLKNILLGSDLPTLGDLGGLNGIWARLTGNVPAIDPAEAAAQAAAQSVATMQVTAASVIIGGAGVSQFLSTMGGTGAANVNLPDSAVTSQIWEFFKGKGLQPHQIAAIVGNAAGESGFDPRAVGDNGTSFGLFQHHASRADGLLSAVGGVGGLGNVQGQLEYVWRELLTSENGALQKLLATTNVQDATSVWMRDFERPHADAMIDSWPTRLGAAEAALTRFGSTATDATKNLGTLGTGFDTFGGALASVAQSFASGGGSGGLTGILGTIGSALAGVIGLPGFAKGGATGGSDPSRVAGLVHEEEFVFDAEATRRIGVQNLEAIRRGRMPGYARGGYVSNAGDYAFLSEGSANGNAPIDMRPVINVQNNTSIPVEKSNIEETTGPRGQRQYTLALSDAVATGLTTPGGKAGRAIRTNYGLTRGSKRRT